MGENTKEREDLVSGPGSMIVLALGDSTHKVLNI